MKTNNKTVLTRLFLSCLLVMPAVFLSLSVVEAAEDCGDEFYINETLPNGARWDMCWEHRNREGIVLNKVYFTPKGGVRRMVLNQAAIAQIHVPYDDNGARFHDLSDYGIGGSNILNIQADECPAGALLKFNGKNVICKQIEKRNIAFKSDTNTARGYNLSLFSVSPVSAYYYIPTWRFMDDGSIEPWMGATGALQRFGTNQASGWQLGDNRVGIAHLHNFFWKLDFDLNTTHLNDVVEEVNFQLENGIRSRRVTVFSNESARKVNPETMRHWRISDSATKNSNNHNISYDIKLNQTGHQDIGPADEPFTHNDFFVTKHNDQEKFASHNSNISGSRNVAEFVNGESLINTDTVIWAGVTFYHMPRSEDAPHMDAHWSHLQIIPRDWSASNLLSSQNPNNNSAPSIVTPPNQSSVIGTPLSLNVQANDADGDSLSYSATGLPTGLSINSSTGQISGTVTTTGSYQIRLTVSDGQIDNSTQFNWSVTDGGSGGGGAFSLQWLFLLVFFVSVSTRLLRYR